MEPFFNRRRIDASGDASMVGGVKALYAVLLPLVLGVGCGESKEEKAAKAKAAAEAKAAADWKVIEAAIRESLKKPTGELTKSDYEKVTKLVLSYKQLTDVKGLEKLTKFKRLSVGGNPVRDVKGLENLTQLEMLLLSDNKLTKLPEGLEKLTQLTELYLDDNQLTNVEGLEKLNQLKKLYLKRNPDLTKAQIDELQKALPKCEIDSNPTK